MPKNCAKVSKQISQIKSSTSKIDCKYLSTSARKFIVNFQSKMTPKTSGIPVVLVKLLLLLATSKKKVLILTTVARLRLALSSLRLIKGFCQQISNWG